MTVIWLLLIGCFVAVAGERYFKRQRSVNAKEQAFIAEAAQAAYEAKRQQDTLKRTIELAGPPTGAPVADTPPAGATPI